MRESALPLEDRGAEMIASNTLPPTPPLEGGGTEMHEQALPIEGGEREEHEQALPSREGE